MEELLNGIGIFGIALTVIIGGIMAIRSPGKRRVQIVATASVAFFGLCAIAGPIAANIMAGHERGHASELLRSHREELGALINDGNALLSRSLDRTKTPLPLTEVELWRGRVDAFLMSVHPSYVERFANPEATPYRSTGTIADALAPDLTRLEEFAAEL